MSNHCSVIATDHPEEAVVSLLSNEYQTIRVRGPRGLDDCLSAAPSGIQTIQHFQIAALLTYWSRLHASLAPHSVSVHHSALQLSEGYQEHQRNNHACASSRVGQG